jgi:hypothetical protein
VNQNGEGVFGNDCVSHKDLIQQVPTVDGVYKSVQGSSHVENIWKHARKVRNSSYALYIPLVSSKY